MKHTNDLPYACKQCDKKFPSGSSMRTHIKNIHERKNCSECGMTVSNTYWLRRHMVYTHGVKEEEYGALKCDFCTKMFFQPASKEKHMEAVHFNEMKLMKEQNGEICVDRESNLGPPAS